jgi:nucleoside-diphosphate kinase
MKNEQTLSIIKPDAVERNLAEDIKKIFIKNNLKIKDNKKILITKDEASEFYKVHQSNHFIMIYVLTYHLDQL